MVPEEITTLEEAVDSFQSGKDKESEGKFDQSDTAARTCIARNRDEWGLNDEQILKHIGTQTDTGQTTMWGRLLVGRVFPKHWRDAPENAWCQTKHWSHYEVCARQWSDDDPDAPVAWLRYCVENDLSVRRLKAEIKAAGGDPNTPRPIYVVDAEMVTIERIAPSFVVLRFDHPLPEPLVVAPGERVAITIVKKPEPEELPDEEEPEKVPA